MRTDGYGRNAGRLRVPEASYASSIVDDAFAARLPLVLGDGSVDVVSPPGGAVPVPATLLLLGSGLAAWLLRNVAERCRIYADRHRPVVRSSS